MKTLLLVGTVSMLTLLGGCVVAPIPEPVGYGPPRVVYAPPPPAVVVRPAPAYRYYGPRPYWHRW